MTQTHKYTALDSLRGIAALMVVFQHFWEMNHVSEDRLKPWLFFCAGHEAVILFFVLSGFVLTHQLNNYQLCDYHKFVLRRVFRIYPAYYFAILASAVSLIIISQKYPSDLAGYGLTNWFYIWSSTHFDNNLLWSSITLISHQGNSLDVATWSLFYEMWISFLFPFALYLLWHKNHIVRVSSIIILFGISYYFWKQNTWLDNSWQAISYYLWYFLLGVVLYFYNQKLKFVANNLYLLLGVGLYFSNYLLYGVIHDRFIHEVIIAVGCFIILQNAIHHKKFQHLINSKITLFYGKISYSLYLLHLPILYTLSYLILHHAPRSYYHDAFSSISNSYILITKMLTFFLASTLSWLVYRYIEMPAIKFAKQLHV